MQVADPYRWLEADVRHAPEVADWVAAQNQITAAYLAAIPATGGHPPPLDRAVRTFPSIHRP